MHDWKMKDHLKTWDYHTGGWKMRDQLLWNAEATRKSNKMRHLLHNKECAHTTNVLAITLTYCIKIHMVLSTKQQHTLIVIKQATSNGN